MSAELSANSYVEVGHILFLDIVSYSKLLSGEQRNLFELLNDIVRRTQQFRSAEAARKLVRTNWRRYGARLLYPAAKGIGIAANSGRSFEGVKEASNADGDSILKE